MVEQRCRVNDTMLWLNPSTKVKLCKPAGSATFSMFWSKFQSRVKLCNPAGSTTFSMLWLNSSPKVKTVKLLATRRVASMVHPSTKAIYNGAKQWYRQW